MRFDGSWASDRASESQQIHPLDAPGRRLGERSIRHSGAELSELCDWSATKTGASPAAIAVAIELPGMAWWCKCCSRCEFQVYAINPKQLIGSATALALPVSRTIAEMLISLLTRRGPTNTHCEPYR
jgi:hypothetical protein